MADTALFTREQLASLVQGDLDTATADLVRDMATSAVQSYTDQWLFYVVDEQITLPGSSEPVLFLPQRPVVGVSAVSISGTALTDYSLLSGGRLSRRLGWYWPSAYPSVTVTYTHGYFTIPANIRAAALLVARRLYENPAGLRSETIGSYAYTVGGTGEVGGLTLTPDEQQLLGGRVTVA